MKKISVKTTITIAVLNVFTVQVILPVAMQYAIQPPGLVRLRLASKVITFITIFVKKTA